MQYYILDSHPNYNSKCYLLSSNNSAAFHMTTKHSFWNLQLLLYI